MLSIHFKNFIHDNFNVSWFGLRYSYSLCTGLYNAVFWIFDENNVSNTNFQLLQSSAYTKSGMFQVPAACMQR